jgi:hypothetical protein
MSNQTNTLIAEDKQYYKWEREQKNKILSMVNGEKRQKLWQEMFGTKQKTDDSYLEGNIF